MMFGQQPYVYQQPIYNQPIGQPISQPMQEPMMRPQYQPAPQMPAYQPQPQQPQNQSIIWIPNEQAANDYLRSCRARTGRASARSAAKRHERRICDPQGV